MPFISLSLGLFLVISIRTSLLKVWMKVVLGARILILIVIYFALLLGRFNFNSPFIERWSLIHLSDCSASIFVLLKQDVTETSRIACLLVANHIYWAYWTKSSKSMPQSMFCGATWESCDINIATRSWSTIYSCVLQGRLGTFCFPTFVLPFIKLLFLNLRRVLIQIACSSILLVLAGIDAFMLWLFLVFNMNSNLSFLRVSGRWWALSKNNLKRRPSTSLRILGINFPYNLVYCSVSATVLVVPWISLILNIVSVVVLRPWILFVHKILLSSGIRCLVEVLFMIVVISRRLVLMLLTTIAILITLGTILLHLVMHLLGRNDALVSHIIITIELVIRIPGTMMARHFMITTVLNCSWIVVQGRWAAWPRAWSLD